MVMMQNAGVNQDLEVARKVLIMQRAEWNYRRGGGFNATTYPAARPCGRLKEVQGSLPISWELCGKALAASRATFDLGFCLRGICEAKRQFRVQVPQSITQIAGTS